MEQHEQPTEPFWAGLDSTNQWADSIGELTRYHYYTGSQNGYQHGNVTEVQELTHAEPALDYNSWQSRVTNKKSSQDLGVTPALIRRVAELQPILRWCLTAS